MAAKKKPAASPKQQQTADGAWPECQVDGCDNPVLHRGLCSEHWTGKGK